jgi:hypothetical protein
MRIEMLSRVMPGVVHQDVDLAHRRLGLLGQAVDVGGIVHPGGDHVGALAELALSCSSASARVPDSVTVAPCLCSARAIAPPMPPEAPGDQRGLAGKIEHAASLGGLEERFDVGRRVERQPVISRSMRFTRPDSTLPVPHSTSMSTPWAFMYCTLSRQRTMAVTCSTSRCLMSAGLVISDASTLATSGHPRRRQRHLLQRLLHGVGGGLHQRAMEGRAHRQHHAALGAARLGRLDRPLDRRLVAAHHDLAAAIVVGDGHDLALRRLLAGLLCRSSSMPSSAAIAPSPTGTAFCIDWPRSFRAGARRRAAASRRGQGRIFAERMAGDMRGQRRQRLAAVLLQDPHDGHADRHQGRLGVLGQDQLGFGPFAHQFRQVLLQRLVDLLEDVAGGREGAGQVAPMPTAWDPVPERRKRDSWAGFSLFLA